MYYKMGHGFYFREVTRIADYLGISLADMEAGRVDVTALAPVPRASTRAYVYNPASAWGLAA